MYPVTGVMYSTFSERLDVFLKKFSDYLSIFSKKQGQKILIIAIIEEIINARLLGSSINELSVCLNDVHVNLIYDRGICTPSIFSFQPCTSVCDLCVSYCTSP